MNTINITPVTVAFNKIANAVSFQVLTLDLTPEKFYLNAKFFNVFENNKIELANVPFELPIEDYKNWQNDAELEAKCLTALNLNRA